MTPVFIESLGTALPPYRVTQQYARETMKDLLAGNRLAQRLIHRLYSQSGIEARYTVMPDFLAPDDAPEVPRSGLFLNEQGAYCAPTTKMRNQVYIKAARPLARRAAEDALQGSSLKKQDITHIVTASCTGFSAPGLDYMLLRDLGLAADVQRYHVGFMGCYAAFPALKIAKAFCQADPHAVVLVVCLELCTLHLQMAGDPDTLLSGSVFADGAGAALVTAKPAAKACYELSATATTLTEMGEADMAWAIGDEGFDIVLSSYVPEILEANIAEAIAPLLASYGVAVKDVARWAVHPGGRAILDKVQKGLALPEGALDVSRSVLCDYGNMSSATILFVLARMALETPVGEQVCAMAFGPGLTVESALLTRA